MQHDIPLEAWDRIGRFLDIPVKNNMTLAKLPYAVEVCTAPGRKGGEDIAESIIAQSIGTTTFVSRAGLERYAGYVAPRDAQRASMYAELIRRRNSWDQTMDPVFGVDDEEMRELGLAFDPWEEVDEMLTPQIHRYGDHLHPHDVFLPNPYLYQYKLLPLGNAARVGRLGESEQEAVRVKRSSVLHLKAYFFAVFASGFPVNALAGGVDADAPTKYHALWQMVVGWLMEIVGLIYGMAMWLCSHANLDWYRAMSPELQAAADLAALAMVLMMFRRVTKPVGLNLAVRTPQKPDQFLGQVLGEKGMVYKVRVNGVEHTLTSSDERTGCHQDEMAMPGSEYFPCRAQPVGALLVTTTDSDVQLFGMFWRMDDYLVTARHCSNVLSSSTARVYLASIKQTKKGNYEIDRVNLYRAPDDFFTPENNVIASYDVDAFAREVDAKVWSQIGLNRASTKVRSAYGQQVQSVGFTSDGLLVSASGKTLPDSGYEFLHHTASTQKGFSGSILLCGNSVIGMHVSAAGEHNVAVRTELIQYLIDVGTGLEMASKNKKKYTYADASYKEQYRQHKWRGGVVQMKQMRDGKYSIVLDNGEATFGWDLNGLVECFGITGDPRKDFDQFQDLLYQSSPVRGRYIDYDDERYHKNTYENASVISSGKRRRPATKGIPSSRKKLEPKSRALPYTVTEGFKRVHGPTAPKEQPEAKQVFEDYKEEIVALGFEEGVFAYPDMSPEVERKSLEAHLQLFGDRVRTVVKPPTEAEEKRCASIVAQMMQAASFVPDHDYKTTAGILDVIHSSIIDPKKSSGYPYCAQGQPTNKQVLAAMGEQGFAQHVLNQWDTLEFEAKVFLKGEPTKKSKLDKGMPRVIAGFPLDVTVKHAAVFRNLSFSAVKNWKKTPVKYAFAPANPGHLEHMSSVLNGAVWESDKSTWDYNFYQWIANVTCGSVKHLALQPKEWTTEQYKEYLLDVENCFKQVFEHATYRTSDGTCFKPTSAGIMKSGWFMTIVANSIAQLAVHVMACMRLEMTDEEIMDLPIVAGGDDVNQAPVPAGIEAYLLKAQELGVAMEIHEREDLWHSEYFSSDLRMGKEGPEYFPKRWTKHIEHLKVIKREFLGDALCSHMENYRHDDAKFAVLRKMYLTLNERYPHEFPLNRMSSQNLLRARQYGYEHALC
nr:polyprotein [Sobelivirales sp.]WRQ64837.1 polyprotein [Sobelivirales sp.]